jgi:arylsulfatase
MRWPGVIPAGEICSKLSSSVDLLPTLAAVAGAKLPDKKIDGVNIFPLMKGEKDANPRREFLYYYGQNNLEAVQIDFWKLVLPHSGRTYRGQMPGNDGWPGQTGTETVTSVQLYDLRRDPGEWYDVSELYPEKVKELEDLAEKARQDLGDDLNKTAGANRRKIGSIND